MRVPLCTPDGTLDDSAPETSAPFVARAESTEQRRPVAIEGVADAGSRVAPVPGRPMAARLSHKRVASLSGAQDETAQDVARARRVGSAVGMCRSRADGDG